MNAQQTFADDAVPMQLLRQRAYNRRWAEQGEGVIPLTAADPDFRVAPVIRERIAQYAVDGVLGYGPPQGLPDFRGAVADWMRSTRQIACDAGDVLATDGAAAAIAVVALASLRPGDEVLIPDPVDFLFRHTIERVGATAVPVGLSIEKTAEQFIAAMHERLTPRTRMLWLCNPNNPLGIVHERGWLDAVVHWAVGRGLRILSDEVWSDIVYEPYRHVSPASLSPAAAANVSTVYGFSKNFGLAGLRVGCVVCTNPRWFREIMDASGASQTIFGASTLSQVAATAAMEEGRQWLKEFLAHLAAQRDRAVSRLARWPGVRILPPQGTYVAFADVRGLTSDTESFCADLKASAGVVIVPGLKRWFGPGADGHVRLCFATSRRILDTAFDRMDAWVEALR